MRVILTLTLLLLLATTALGGCVTRIGDDDPANRDPWSEGTPSVERLYSKTWAGMTIREDPVEVPRAYDYLRTTYTHTGHTLGTATFTDADGEAMDEAPMSQASGAVVIDRLLPGTPGTAKVTIPGAIEGAGVYTVDGIDNIRPTNILSATFTERTDGFGPLATTIRFYVPPALDDLQITFVGVSQVNPGVTITDPAGNERASMGIDGTGATASTTPAQTGVWSLQLQGPYQGVFVVSVQAI